MTSELPVYAAADGLFKSSHGRFLIQDLHAFVGGVCEGVPVCRRELLHRRLLHKHTGNIMLIWHVVCVTVEDVTCDGADMNLQSAPQLLLSLDLCVGETLGQLRQLLLSGRSHSWVHWQHWRLPAVPKRQHTRGEVMILRPLQPAHTSNNI